MAALENRRASSLAAPSMRLLAPSERATSNPKNRIWDFENSPSGRPSIDQQLSWETAAGSVQYTYQIASGRAEWLSRDPLKNAERSQGPNLYDYVGNNPIDRIDPMGLTWADDASMTWDWATGQAPPNTGYGPNTNQTQDMMQAPGVQNAINYFNNKNSGKCPNQQQPVTHYDVPFGLSGLWNAGTNSTQQFVGSYSVDIYPNASNGTISVQVNNTTSVTSLLYGMYPNALNPLNGYPMGNASQQYSWTQPDTAGGGGSGGCGCNGGGGTGGAGGSW